MAASANRKLVRSYRLVFERRWRIFRLQDWRIPLPNGIELRAIAYWLAALLALLAAANLPLLGPLVRLLPDPVRLVALPLVAAAALSRWEIDGRSPHRALAGLISYRLRPRSLAGLRRCPPVGTELTPLDHLALAPDLTTATAPAGRITGPARLLLRYPAEIRLERVSRGAGEGRESRLAAARRWRLRLRTNAAPLHRAKLVQVPPSRQLIFTPPAQPGRTHAPSPPTPQSAPTSQQQAAKATARGASMR
jgi:hypothetical protein